MFDKVQSLSKYKGQVRLRVLSGGPHSSLFALFSDWQAPPHLVGGLLHPSWGDASGGVRFGPQSSVLRLS